MLAERDRSKWRGGERQRVSGHGDQKRRDMKTPAQRKAIRTCRGDRLLQFSQLRPGLPFRGKGLFLTSQGDVKYKKTRHYLLKRLPHLSNGKADNRIFSLRVIGPASMRLAL